MIVRDLLNALQRFPGRTGVTLEGRLCVGDVCIAVGDVCASQRPREGDGRTGYKGAAGLVLDDVQEADKGRELAPVVPAGELVPGEDTK